MQSDGTAASMAAAAFCRAPLVLPAISTPVPCRSTKATPLRTQLTHHGLANAVAAGELTAVVVSTIVLHLTGQT